MRPPLPRSRRALAAAVLLPIAIALVGCPSSDDAGLETGSGSSSSSSSSSSGGGGSTPATPDGSTPGSSNDASPDGSQPTVSGGWTPPVVPTTSAGCGTGPSSIAKGTTRTVAGGRTYHVWGPAGYDRTKTWPVVAMFHGIGTNGPDFQDWFEMEKYVDNKAIVIYLDADNGYWDLSGDSDLTFFDDAMKDLGDRYCIDPSRVLGFGFSLGAYMASYLGCRRAGWVKAISAGDGGWGGSSDPCGRLPVLITHRTADPDESVANGKANAARWTTLNGCTGGSFTSNPSMNCTSQKDCVAPGAVTFCEDTFVDPDWPSDWNHTVRENYRSFTWNWFAALP